MSWRNSDGFSQAQKRNRRTARPVRPAVRQLHFRRFVGFFVGAGQGAKPRIGPSVTRSASREVGIEGENSENSITRFRSALCRFSRGTVGNQLPRQAQGLSVQFSMFNLGTRPNSRVLFVTSVTPRLRAWAAMNRSFAPIIVPRVFKWARIFA
jgi:hypothetical protein